MDANKNKKGAVRILHLYYDLMNLYGDWANAAVFARELGVCGCETKTDYLSVGDEIDFGAYGIVFIGSGTERSQRACMRDMTRFADSFVERIEAGMFVLATGNSHELFGKAITEANGERFRTLGLLDFETTRNDSRVTGDCVCKAAFLPDRLIGFINRAGNGQKGDIERPFLAELGPGSEDKSAAEGIMYKNLLGTYMTGPIIARNPPLMKYIAGRLYPDADGERLGDDPFFGYQEAAYRMALTELSARIQAARP